MTLFSLNFGRFSIYDCVYLFLLNILLSVSMMMSCWLPRHLKQRWWSTETKRDINKWLTCLCQIQSRPNEFWFQLILIYRIEYLDVEVFVLKDFSALRFLIDLLDYWFLTFERLFMLVRVLSGSLWLMMLRFSWLRYLDLVRRLRWLLLELSAWSFNF